MSFSDPVELALLNQMFGGVARPIDPTIFAALSTTDPGETGAGMTEPTIGTGGYARASLANTLANFPSANPKLNGVVIIWPTATADLLNGANMLWVAFFNTASGTAAAGFLGRGQIAGTPKGVFAGDTPAVDVGKLTITMD
jgi:hypothetical protein